MAGFDFRLSIGILPRRSQKESRGGAARGPARGPAWRARLGGWLHRRRGGLAILAAVGIPLLLVGGAWATGVVRLPRLEAATGWKPPFVEESPEASQAPGVFLRVASPAQGELLGEAPTLWGEATPHSEVYCWEQGRNVPVVIPVTEAGSWVLTLAPGSLAQGARVLVFASTDGRTWSEAITRSVEVLPPPSAAQAGEAPAPVAPTWMQRLPQPLLVVAQAATSLLSGVSISVAEATSPLRMGDLNQDGVADWFQTSAIEPTRIPARLTPVISTPAWLNSILVLVVLAGPLGILVARRPDRVVDLLRQRLVLGHAERERRRAFRLASHKQRLAESLERDAMKLGYRTRKERRRESLRLAREANKLRMEAYRLQQETRRLETGAHLEAQRRQEAAALEAKRLEREAEEARLARAERSRTRAPQTIIHVGLPRSRRGKAQRDDVAPQEDETP